MKSLLIIHLLFLAIGAIVLYNIAYEQGARHGIVGYVTAHPECK